MIEVVVILILAAHLACMNVAAASPVLSVWCEYREALGDTAAGVAGRQLVKLGLLLFLAGMVLGLLLGWLVWEGGVGTAVSRFPSRVFFGILELVFSFVLGVAHWAWWTRAPVSTGRRRRWRCLLPLLAGTNLLYHFPFFFAIVGNLAAEGIAAGEPLDGSFRTLLADGDVLSRGLHFVLAAIAMTGVVFAGCALRVSSDNKRLAAWGGRVALLASVVQIPVGIWMITQLSSSAKARLLGGDPIGTLLLLAALGVVFWLFHELAALALSEVDQRNVTQALGVMLLVILLMTGVLRRSRVVKPTPASMESSLNLGEDFDGVRRYTTGHGSRELREDCACLRL